MAWVQVLVLSSLTTTPLLLKTESWFGMMQIYFLILAVSVQVVQSILATRALHRAYALMLNQTVTAPTATGVLEPLGGSPLTV
ncbi:unnamed protein product [Didymodactylos carnosus]|uniref:Uncharacterized protein n=1 Tax=Didymodactylos carnosus TaxID=1234261 RepID=A0A8S2DPR9_9BILA|nr:unnamed protein product [Didymodactylos carnosus]CAF3738714.1 unnamed protein product [Didymodactylos carnosus]